jgi:hypothetical protein
MLDPNHPDAIELWLQEQYDNLSDRLRRILEEYLLDKQNVECLYAQRALQLELDI